MEKMEQIRRSNSDIFSEVYENGIWGQSSEDGERFYSGVGTHDPVLVNAYQKVVSNFLEIFSRKLDGVDLGCGDFNVGSKIRPLCRNYVACDVVESLIERNQSKYADSDVDFRSLDIVNDELPDGEVVFVRQVFQHLSNAAISKVVEKIQKKFQVMIITEHLPLSKAFVPNRDFPTGPSTRMAHEDGPSGVVLTEPPFSLALKSKIRLLDYFDYGGYIRSDAYVLKPTRD